jgi:hypothetical protein
MPFSPISIQAVIRAKGKITLQKPEGLLRNLSVTDQHRNKKQKNHIPNVNLVNLTLCMCKENRYKQGISINSTKKANPKGERGFFSMIAFHTK